MPAVIAVIAAIIGLVYVVQDNYLLCRDELCREEVRNKQYAEMKAAEHKQERAVAEAPDRFDLEKAERAAAATVRINESEARKIEAQAKIDSEREVQIARINADKEARIAKNAVDLAKIQGETRVGLARAEGRREGGGLIGMMCRNGMGRCGQRPQQRMVNCSPRHGCPRRPQRARGHGLVVPYAAVPSYVRVVGPGHSRGY